MVVTQRLFAFMPPSLLQSDLREVNLVPIFVVMNSFSVILNSKAIMSNVPCYSVLTQDLSLAYQCASDESVNFETKSSVMLLSVHSSEMKKIAMN